MIMRIAGVSCKGVLLLIVLAVAGCATVPPRLQESGLNSRFAVEQNLTFDAYVHRMRTVIERARVDIDETNRDTVLQANSPFELRPDEALFPKRPSGKYGKAILLIHGLSDSPYVMRPIALYLQSRGFLVRAILLPGHGTVPGDLLKVSYEDWIKAVSYGVGGLKAEAEQVFVGGFSTGGALGVLQALEDREIKGLVLFAPALALKRDTAGLAGISRIFTNWIGSPRDDVDYARYESFAVNAAYQLYLLNETIGEAWQAGKRVVVPVFVAVSDDDRTVDASRTLERIADICVSKKNKAVRFTKNPGRDSRGDGGSVVFEDSRLPRARILDLAHIGLTIPPDDPHYGQNGGYRSCLHYAEQPVQRMACLRDEGVWKGETTAENLKMGTVRRLSYNPMYRRMTELLDRFLNDLDVLP